MTEDVTVRFGSGWPFPSPMWQDPPWSMTGTVITAWFHAEPGRLAELAHADFAPMHEGSQTRLRFYDIVATSGGRSTPFQEAVVAFRTSYRGVHGELSALMWTDSIPYLTWGREVFGWPLQYGEVNLQGGLWDGEATADAFCQTEGLSLESVRVESERTLAPSDPTVWITPQRRLSAVNVASEERRVLAIRPRVVHPGRSFRCSGSLDVRELFGEVQNVEIDAVTGVTIEVGDDVAAIE